MQHPRNLRSYSGIPSEGLVKPSFPGGVALWHPQILHEMMRMNADDRVLFHNVLQMISIRTADGQNPAPPGKYNTL